MVCSSICISSCAVIWTPSAGWENVPNAPHTYVLEPYEEKGARVGRSLSCVPSGSRTLGSRSFASVLTSGSPGVSASCPDKMAPIARGLRRRSQNISQKSTSFRSVSSAWKQAPTPVYSIFLQISWLTYVIFFLE